MTTATKTTTDHGAAAYRAFGYLLLLGMLLAACSGGLVLGVLLGLAGGR